MPRWEHRRCGTVVDGRVPPDNCDFCAQQLVRVTKFTEQGWRHVGPSAPPRPGKRRRRIAASKRRRIYERDGYRCVGCGLDGSGNPAELLTLDHVIPIAAGGGDEDSNLQTMCHPCNTAKADSVPGR